MLTINVESRRCNAVATLVFLSVLMSACGAVKAGSDIDWPEELEVSPTAPTPWPPVVDSLEVTYDCGQAEACTIERFMRMTGTCALFVLKDGRPVLDKKLDSNETCANYNKKTLANKTGGPYRLASITKSITALMLGMTSEDPAYGPKLDLAAPAADAFSVLKLSYPRQVSLGAFLQMRSGMRWSEKQSDRVIKVLVDSDKRLVNPKPFASLLDSVRYHAKNTRFDDGLAFNYSSFDSTLMGLLVTHRLRTSGKAQNLAEAMKVFFWEPLGMVGKAEWKGDFVGNLAGYCCLKMQPEDLARLGQWVLEHYQMGANGGGNMMARWMRRSVKNAVETTKPDEFTCRFLGETQRLKYGYQWWVLSGEPLSFTGRGFKGQFLHIMPSHNMVVVQFSHFPSDLGGSEECHSYLVHKEIAKALEGRR